LKSLKKNDPLFPFSHREKVVPGPDEGCLSLAHKLSLTHRKRSPLSQWERVEISLFCNAAR